MRRVIIKSKKSENLKCDFKCEIFFSIFIILAILGLAISIGEFLKRDNLEIVKQNEWAIKYIENPSLEVIILAVEKDPSLYKELKPIIESKQWLKNQRKCK